MKGILIIGDFIFSFLGNIEAAGSFTSTWGEKFRWKDEGLWRLSRRR